MRKDDKEGAGTKRRRQEEQEMEKEGEKEEVNEELCSEQVALPFVKLLSL